MKKLLIFLFSLSLIAVIIALPKSFTEQSASFKNAIIVTDLVSAESIGEPFVINGNDAIIEVNEDDFFKILDKNDVKSVIFYLTEDEFEQFESELRLQEISKIKLDNMDVTYSYTPLYSKSYISGGKKINAEIVRKDNQVIIGFPTIAIGY